MISLTKKALTFPELVALSFFLSLSYIFTSFFKLHVLYSYPLKSEVAAFSSEMNVRAEVETDMEKRRNAICAFNDTNDPFQKPFQYCLQREVCIEKLEQIRNLSEIDNELCRIPSRKLVRDIRGSPS